jgi:hypothetical protein
MVGDPIYLQYEGRVYAFSSLTNTPWDIVALYEEIKSGRAPHLPCTPEDVQKYLDSQRGYG